MNKTKLNRLISILDFFAGLFFGIAIFGAYLAFQIVSPLIASLLAAISVFTFFIFLVIVTRYFIAKISLSNKEIELLEKIVAKLEDD